VNAISTALTRHVLTLLEPIGLLWLALIVLALLLWRKRQRGFAFATGSLAAAVYVIGATSFPDMLLRSLEQPYAGVNVTALPTADAVVMLGGGLTPSSSEIAGLHLTKAGDRIIMALEMIRLGKATVLICGGASEKTDEGVKVEADLFKQALLDRRVPVPEIISLGACIDTHDEAVRTRALAEQRGWRRILLVTSASHLRRAVATFRTLGMEVVPVPCNFLAARTTRVFAVPSYGGFEEISTWMHEQIGWCEYRRRGWIDPAKVGYLAR
jgi:uncharacterized SAM-binding protein YcdF (DUF218 family)